MKKLVVPTLVLAVFAVGVGLVFSRVKQSSLEQENQSLREQLENLTAGRPLTPATVTEAPPPERDTTDTELVRLRGEITNLRRDQQELQKLRAENQTLRAQNETRSSSQTAPADPAAPKKLSRNDWTFSGFANPESALQSLLWAGASGDSATALAALTPEQIARMKTEDNRNRTDEELAAELAKQISKVKSYQVLETRNLSDNEAVLTLFIDGLEGSEQTPRMKMQLIDNQWRLAGPYNPGESKQQ